MIRIFLEIVINFFYIGLFRNEMRINVKLVIGKGDGLILRLFRFIRGDGSRDSFFGGMK